MNPDRIVSENYSFVAGPSWLNGPEDSQCIREVMEYSWAEVTETLLGIPGVRARGAPEADWKWNAVWESKGSVIYFGKIASYDRRDVFGCMDLSCNCRKAHLLQIWESLQSRHPGLWLFDRESSLLLTQASLCHTWKFNPAWFSSTVTALAWQIHDTRDFSAMPILADALQEAGCDNADILDHCRGPGPHVLGCWVVDKLLAKSEL